MNLDEYKESFLEESKELLDSVEQSFLNTDTSNICPNVINDIFRYIHSIKGTGGSFGLTTLTSFAHEFETLLDILRNDLNLFSQEIIDHCLICNDCLKDIIVNEQSGNDPDKQNINELIQKTKQIISEFTGKIEEIPTKEKTITESHNIKNKYHITFIPNAELFTRGVELQTIFDNLHAMGDVNCECDISSIPNLEELDIDKLYLSWEIIINTSKSLEEIQSVFDWVSVDSWIEIEKQENDNQNPKHNSQAKTHNNSQNEINKNATSKETDKDSTIRVQTKRVDYLINLVGELIITQTMLEQMGTLFEGHKALPQLEKTITRLGQHTRMLQENIMGIRMMPIGAACSRLPRIVRDLSQKQGKEIELIIHGEQTEVDKNVIEKLTDPIVHIVRNSIDHGIETPQDRKESGKSEKSKLLINSYYQGSNVILEIIDDGKGLDKERILEKAIEKGLVAPNIQMSDEHIYQLIFEPGFSTAKEVTEGPCCINHDIKSEASTDLH